MKILKMRISSICVPILTVCSLVAGSSSYARDCVQLAIPDGLEEALAIQEQSSRALEAKINGRESFSSGELAAARKAYERCVYLKSYENATTLNKIRFFEKTYADNDPDGLIEKLAATKRQLKIDRYHQGFASMSAISDLEAFIADYANYDPDGIVPEARRRLASERQRVAEEEKKAAEERLASDRAKAIADLERQIIWCQHQSISAHQDIDRENRIGLVSGYVDKLVLRRAGERIVSCNESIPNNFAEYKRLGGTKRLADLK